MGAAWLTTDLPRGLGWMLIGFALVSGCSLVPLEEPAQCAVDADCGDESPVSLLCEEGLCVRPTNIGRWSCFDDKDGEYTMELRFRDNAIEPVSSGVARRCITIDPECEEPSWERPLEEGNLRVEGPFLRDRLEVSVPGFMPIIVMPEPHGAPLPFLMFSPETFSSLALQTDATVSDQMGHLIVQIASCEGREGGATVQVDKRTTQTVTRYFREGQPSAMARATDDETPQAVVGNLPGGFVDVVVDTADGSKTFRKTVFIRPGSITYWTISPEPDQWPQLWHDILSIY